MTHEIDPKIAAHMIEALSSGRLDHLFTETNTRYYGRSGFEALRFGSGLPREAVWQLLSSIRRATGLLVFESAWGDFQVRVTPTAELMRGLYEIDTAPSRSLFGRSGIPADEEWIVMDRLLVEEAVLIALGKTDPGTPSARLLTETREGVIRVLFDDAKPADLAQTIASRFYRAMRRLPDVYSDPLTPEYIADTHRLLREGEPDAGIYRTTAEPDPAARPAGPGSVPERIAGEIEALCAYSEADDVPFIHPLIKTLAIGSWMRRVQPFDTYNYLVGRLVSMGFALRYGYQVTGIADPELRLQERPENPAGGDSTARFIAQLEVIRQARTLAESELRQRVERYREVTARFASLGVNHRQAFVLDRALRDPEARFNLRHHARTRQLAYETARQDFLKLIEMGLMEQRKRGRAFEFRLAPEAGPQLDPLRT